MSEKLRRYTTGGSIVDGDDAFIVHQLKVRLRKALTFEPPEGGRAIIAQKVVLTELYYASDRGRSLWYDRMDAACACIVDEHKDRIIRLKFEDLALTSGHKIVVLVQMMWKSP